jgi:hypothetical protein
MPKQKATDMKWVVKQMTALANKKFGSDWSLVIGHEAGEPQVEARQTSRQMPAGRKGGRVVQSLVWCNGRIESRTTVAAK